MGGSKVWYHGAGVRASALRTYPLEGCPKEGYQQEKEGCPKEGRAEGRAEGRGIPYAHGVSGDAVAREVDHVLRLQLHRRHVQLGENCSRLDAGEVLRVGDEKSEP